VLEAWIARGPHLTRLAREASASTPRAQCLRQPSAQQRVQNNRTRSRGSGRLSCVSQIPGPSTGQHETREGYPLLEEQSPEGVRGPGERFRGHGLELVAPPLEDDRDDHTEDRRNEQRKGELHDGNDGHHVRHEEQRDRDDVQQEIRRVLVIPCVSPPLPHEELTDGHPVLVRHTATPWRVSAKCGMTSIANLSIARSVSRWFRWPKLKYRITSETPPAAQVLSSSMQCSASPVTILRSPSWLGCIDRRRSTTSTK